jgi:hypothetical protein
MKSKIIISSAVFALSALSASAGTSSTVSANLDDAILDFRVTDGSGQGASTNLEVDLGSVSQFYNVASGGLTLNGLTDADLIGTYGSTWFTRSDLAWSVIATTGSATGTTINSTLIPASTIWGTNAQSLVGLQSNPWTTKSVGAQNSAITLISPLYATGSGGGGLNGQTHTSNSATAALLASGVAGSYSKQVGSNGNFGFFTSGGSFENGTPGTGLSASDFYQLEPSSNLSPSVYLGTFTLNDNGQLGFSATATVPEPSTYAAILGAITLGFVAFRRRRIRATVQ